MENKKDNSTDFFFWVLAITGVIALLCMYALNQSLASKPCGYINHSGEIEPGYSILDTCACCNDEATLLMSTDEFFSDYMSACPKIYTDKYNELAKAANNALVQRGYKPQYRILKRDK